jgi:hypothetical protein
MRDKEMVSQEVGLDATTQDEWDMQRLGKTQQFKVRHVEKMEVWNEG